jgi:hypothetical protein
VERPIDRLNELIVQQQQLLLKEAQRIVPHITTDDLLQPNDFPALEHHPYFRFEEGILDGLLRARAALLALSQEGSHANPSRPLELSDGPKWRIR